MSHQPDHPRQIRQVMLPSGRRIEVVYFEDIGEQAGGESDGRSTQPAADLHVCETCSSGLVYPTEWEEAGDSQWQVSLRCPNCEWAHTGLYEQDVVERFDGELDRGTESVVRDLQAISRANMEEDVERFIEALRGDHVVPADF